MELSFKWDTASQLWIDTLPARLDDALKTGMVRAIKSGMAVALGSSRFRASGFKFEGDIARDLGLFGLKVKDGTVEMSLGFIGGKVIVDASDVLTAPTPFNYGWAKEASEPAKAHTVWLYNPRTGKSTRSRAKLVRWLKQQGGIWGMLPDAPTKETWNKKGNAENFPPPFVKVDPSKSATDFITGLIADDGDPLATWILESPALDAALRAAWE